MIKKWRAISKKTVFKREHISLTEHKINPDFTYHVIKSTPTVAVVALSGKKLLMVNQYRYPIRKVSLEIPAGMIEKSETSKKAAIRELEEEVGYKTGKIKKIASFHPYPGRMDTFCDVFFATNLKKTKTNHDKHEFMDIVQMSPDQAVDYVIKGKITQSASIVGILAAHERRLI